MKIEYFLQKKKNCKKSRNSKKKNCGIRNSRKIINHFYLRVYSHRKNKSAPKTENLLKQKKYKLVTYPKY